MTEFISKVSSRGQVVIPIEIRESLKLKQGDYVVFIINEDNNVEVKKGKVKIELEDDS